MGCSYSLTHLDRHIKNSHTELSVEERVSMLQETKRREMVRLLTTLRGTNPRPQMVALAQAGPSPSAAQMPAADQMPAAAPKRTLVKRKRLMAEVVRAKKAKTPTKSPTKSPFKPKSQTKPFMPWSTGVVIG